MRFETFKAGAPRFIVNALGANFLGVLVTAVASSKRRKGMATFVARASANCLRPSSCFATSQPTKFRLAMHTSTSRAVRRLRYQCGILNQVHEIKDHKKPKLADHLGRKIRFALCRMPMPVCDSEALRIPGCPIVAE
jgi:hypothetical protein